MKEVKDPEIKLFGRNISSLENGAIPAVYGHNCGVVATTEESCSSDGDRSLLLSDDSSDGNREGEAMETEQLQLQIQRLQNQEVEKEHHLTAESVDNELQETVQPAVMEGPMNSKFIPDSDVKSRTPGSIDEDTTAAKQPKTDCDQSKTANSQQQTLKKPDKILPCPRCNSMDTKFCYYNNYNINQPRHFCKSCQRYWTDGGTMRSVPVGAGRRKNKNSALHFRHITIPEALLAARPDVSNGLCHPAVSPNGRVLSFGSDTPLCESMSSVFNLADQKAPNGVTISCKGAKNGNDCCHGSSAIALNSMGEGGRKCHQEPPLQNINGSQIAWSCPWNSVVPLPAVFPSGFPMPIFLPPFWNCGVSAPWCVPWFSPPSPSTNQKSTGSGPNSPTLGKHSRDGDLLIASSTEENEQVEKNNSEVSILVPKTLRIDDPDEAARSSIWTTLGIKNDFVTRNGLFKGFQPKDNKESHMVTPSPVLQANPGIKNDFLTRNGLFKGFQPKDNKKSHMVTPSPVLQANPAALSRFLNFQEIA